MFITSLYQATDNRLTRGSESSRTSGSKEQSPDDDKQYFRRIHVICLNSSLDVFRFALVTLSAASDNIPVAGLKRAIDALFTITKHLQVGLETRNLLASKHSSYVAANLPKRQRLR